MGMHFHVRSSHHTEFTETRFHFLTPLERLNLFVKRLNLFNRANRSYALFAPSSSPVSSAVAATSPATMSMAPTTDIAKSVLSPPKPNIVCAIDTGIKRSAMNMR